MDEGLFLEKRDAVFTPSTFVAAAYKALEPITGPYYYLVPERKLSFSPISASDKNFNPRNTKCIPAVKILIFLDLDKKS